MIIEKKAIHSPSFSMQNKAIRTIWNIVYLIAFRFSPIPLFAYRRWLLRAFGAKVHDTARVYPSAKIWLPSNLTLANDSTIGPHCNIYNQGEIIIKDRVIISQGAFLCSSTHDYNNQLHPLKIFRIIIDSDAWICADAFVGPDVKVSQGSVVGARAVLFKDTDAWGVYVGNPASKIKNREMFV